MNFLDLAYFEPLDFLTETWLSDKHLDKEILPHNYDVFRVDGKHETDGGLLIAIKDFSFTEVEQVAIDQYPDLEIVCVECSTGKDKQTLVSCSLLLQTSKFFPEMVSLF